jgi:hypothetical protein
MRPRGPAGTVGDMTSKLLPAAVAAALVALPTTAAAQAPDPILSLAPTAGAAPGQSLTLTARCAKGCTLKLRELTVMRFDRKGVQGAGTSTLALKGSKRVPRGNAVAIAVPLADSAGALARKLVADGEYARVAVIADYSGADGARQVQRSIALHKPRMAKLVYADDDGVLRPAAAPKGASKRYRVTVSAVQQTKWSYDRDAARGPGCTVVANGSGTQTLRFAPKRSLVARLVRGRDGRPAFDRRPAPFPHQLFVGGKLTVDRKGTRNAGVRGECDGVYGGTDGGGLPPACNGRATFDAAVLVQYQPDGRLAGYRLPIEEIMSLDRGVDCPVEMGPRAGGDLEMAWVSEPKADPTRAGNPGKYVAILRGKRTDPLPGGSVTTTTTYTVTFRKA